MYSNLKDIDCDLFIKNEQCANVLKFFSHFVSSFIVHDLSSFSFFKNVLLTVGQVNIHANNIQSKLKIIKHSTSYSVPKYCSPSKDSSSQAPKPE